MNRLKVDQAGPIRGDSSSKTAKVLGASLVNSMALPNAVEHRNHSQATMPVGGYTKRVFDIGGSLSLLVILSPVLLLCAAAVKLTSRGPIFFAHSRVGFKGSEFRCLKFRSMRIDSAKALADHLEADPIARAEWAATQKLKNDPRVTRLGHFIRRASLDELPQLVNVLLGDMSLVGPRPVVREELDRYVSPQDNYLLARPGITGLWQVSGRSTASYEERVSLDTRYVNNWSLVGDIVILFKTIVVVVRAKGAV